MLSKLEFTWAVFPELTFKRILLTTNSNFYSIDFPDLKGTEVLKSIQYKETPRILETSSLRLNEFQSVNIVTTHFFMSHMSWKDEEFLGILRMKMETKLAQYLFQWWILENI